MSYDLCPTRGYDISVLCFLSFCFCYHGKLQVTRVCLSLLSILPTCASVFMCIHLGPSEKLWSPVGFEPTSPRATLGAVV